MTLRKATVADVPEMAQLINDNAELGLMLPKSLASLYENVREFFVVEQTGEGVQGTGYSQTPNPVPGTPAPKIVGVCGLSIIWANWGEVASLAVDRGQRGKGLGRKLVEVCLDEAEQLGIARVMTLTYERAFFDKLGFTVLDRQKLPLKVWSECVRCPKNQACDEIAMVRRIEGVPEADDVPSPPKPTQYEVPVVLTTGKTMPNDQA